MGTNQRMWHENQMLSINTNMRLALLQLMFYFTVSKHKLHISKSNEPKNYEMWQNVDEEMLM